MIPLITSEQNRVLVYCKSDAERQRIFQGVLDFVRKNNPNTTIARTGDTTLVGCGAKIDIIFHEDLITKTLDDEWDIILSGKQMEDEIRDWNKLLRIIEQDELDINPVPPEPERTWHPCRYVNGKLEHDGTWEDGKWYEWIDKNDNLVTARMKMDAEDHFFPDTWMHEKDVIAFRDTE